jgi:hypothetical protein
MSRTTFATGTNIKPGEHVRTTRPKMARLSAMQMQKTHEFERFSHPVRSDSKSVE